MFNGLNKREVILFSGLNKNGCNLFNGLNKIEVILFSGLNKNRCNLFNGLNKRVDLQTKE